MPASYQNILLKVYRLEFFRFVCAGAIGFAVDFLVALFCVNVLDISPYIARIFSFAAAIATTYLINRFFTFAERIKKGAQTSRFIPYAAAMLLGIGVNYLTYALCYGLLQKLPVDLALFVSVAAGSLAGLAVNFLVCQKILFKK